MEIIKKNKKQFLKIVLFFTIYILGFVLAFKIENSNVNRQEHRKVISEEIEKNKYEAVQGTAVPNTGYVENVYFNIDLSVDEVINYLYELAPYVDSNQIWLLNDNTDNLIFIGIEDFNTQAFAIVMLDGISSSSNRLVIFANNMIDNSDGQIDFNGWNPSFDGVIEINHDVYNYLIDANNPNVGLGNQLIPNLFSITPFEEPKSIIEIIGNGIADAAIKFGDVITFGFGSIKNIILNEDNTLTYTGSVVVVLVSTAIISFAFRLLLKAFGLIRVG